MLDLYPTAYIYTISIVIALLRDYFLMLSAMLAMHLNYWWAILINMLIKNYYYTNLAKPTILTTYTCINWMRTWTMSSALIPCIGALQLKNKTKRINEKS